MTAKVCRKCGTEKQLGEFYRNPKTADGLTGACAACVRASNQARYLANPGPAKERAMKWASENPERRREIAKRSDDKSRERKAAAAKRRKAEMKFEERRAVNAAANHSRRVRKAGGVGVLARAEVQAAIERAAGRCVYCSKPAKLTIDHFDPVSRGGENSIKNIVPCCLPCNVSKNNRVPEDWLEKRRGAAALARTLLFIEGRDIPDQLHEQFEEMD